MVNYYVSLYRFLSSIPLMARVSVIALIPTILTIIGAIPIMARLTSTKAFINGGLGFAAGIMLVASFTSLLLPALNDGNVVLVLLGFILGIAIIKVLDISIPHLHLRNISNDRYSIRVKKAWLMALAIIIHNIPEGMAVGASSTYGVSKGLAMALAIGIQDLPEGLAVAIPILDITGSRSYALTIGILSGISEFLAALIPPFIASLTHIALPVILALAAGAMIYVVVHEVIPEIYGGGDEEIPTIGFFTGFLLMLILDTLL